jgi:hypothetical protein
MFNIQSNRCQKFSGQLQVLKKNQAAKTMRSPRKLKILVKQILNANFLQDTKTIKS